MRQDERALLSRLADHLKCQVDLGCLSYLGPYQSTLAELTRFDLQAKSWLLTSVPTQEFVAFIFLASKIYYLPSHSTPTTLCLLLHPMMPLELLLRHSIYKKGSGSKLNLSKSKGLWLGS